MDNNMNICMILNRCMHTALAAAVAAVSLAALAACSGADDLFCRYPCRFVFNTNTHAHSAALMAAATGRGVFCTVTLTQHSGASYYAFSNNMGTSDEVIFTGEDQRTTVLLGLNGRIIVGYGNLDDPAVCYAYDGECPNCFSPDAIPVRSYPLSVTSAGMAVCATCRRQFNLNTGGNVVQGDNGRKLNRYRTGGYAAATGVMSVLN